MGDPADFDSSLQQQGSLPAPFGAGHPRGAPSAGHLLAGIESAVLSRSQAASPIGYTTVTTRELPGFGPIHYGASVSTCGRYRYLLTRIWGEARPLANFIMLNPSTADGTTDDPTIRRCMAFARAWGYGGLLVSNLFAFRATDPHELYRTEAPVGHENDAAITACALASGLHVAAWGVHGSLMNRGQAVRTLLWGIRPLTCLGMTKSGQPRHPLYMPSTDRLGKPTTPIPLENP